MSRDFYNVVWSVNSKTCARSLVGRRDRVVWRGKFWRVGVGEREAVERRGQSHTSNGSQIWGFHNCINPAALVVSNRYQVFIT